MSCNRTQDLDLRLGFPLDLEYYSPELKRLCYSSMDIFKYPLPKIRNPEKLEKWKMKDIPSNVYWPDLVDVPIGGIPVVFSNLKTLLFGILDYMWSSKGDKNNMHGSFNCVSPIRDLQLQFSRLTELTLVNDFHNCAGLQFNPQVIPSTLKKV